MILEINEKELQLILNGLDELENLMIKYNKFTPDAKVDLKEIDELIKKIEILKRDHQSQ